MEPHLSFPTSISTVATRHVLVCDPRRSTSARECNNNRRETIKTHAPISLTTITEMKKINDRLFFYNTFFLSRNVGQSYISVNISRTLNNVQIRCAEGGRRGGREFFTLSRMQNNNNPPSYFAHSSRVCFSLHERKTYFRSPGGRTASSPEYTV